MAKLNRTKFAYLISYVSRLADCILAEGTISDLDEMITFDDPVYEPQVIRPSNNDIEQLLCAIQQDRKIEAIKWHRNMTGLGLKESKDIIEKYWPRDAFRKQAYAELEDISKYNDAQREFIKNFLGKF